MGVLAELLLIGGKEGAGEVGLPQGPEEPWLPRGTCLPKSMNLQFFRSYF